MSPNDGRGEMNSTREELIKQVCDFLYDEITENEEFVNLEAVSRRLVDKIVLERERQILDEIEKPLKEFKYGHSVESIARRIQSEDAIDECLAIINRYRKGE